MLAELLAPEAAQSQWSAYAGREVQPEVHNRGLDRLVVLGYVCALGMPPLGLILAIISARRPANRKHAVGIIVVSLIASILWVLIISSGTLSATNDSY